MKKNKVGLIKNAIILALAATFAILCSGCGLFGGQKGDPAVYISQSVIEIEVGQTIQLAAVSTDESEVIWVPGNDAVASVSATGLVKGEGVGETIVTAATSSALASCTIKVKEKTAPPSVGGTGDGEDPEIFVLTLDNIELTVGESITLKVFSNHDEEIEWLTQTPSVASVENGKVTALSEGTTLIMARTSKASARCTVKVNKAESSSTPINPTDPAYKEGYTLVWRDEFEGNSLDTSKWGYQTGTQDRYGTATGPNYWGNGELQYYTQDAVSVSGGSLKITAEKQTMGDRPYTSGRILTRDKASFTYGYFEARMKTPTGDGMWPAFWMLPQPPNANATENEYGGWPANGEIDIMEAKGSRFNKVDTTLHFGKAWDAHDYATKETALSSNTDEWHTYAVDWTADAISWYVDGQKVFTVTKNRWWSQDASNQGQSMPFDKPFYIIFNLAVGGQYDNYAQPGGSFVSATMEVDYVRVYSAN